MVAELKPLTPKTLEVIQTPNGKLRGFKQRDIYHFLGVPYAQAERWQIAKPVQPWKGIRNALNFGPRAFPAGLVFTPWDSCGVAHELYAYDENCLNVNIWSTTVDPEAKKPVIVWMHGGGFSSGSAMEMQAHEGENMSRFGDVVVVTINHRLNIFGFLDVSRFGEKYANSGNAGIADLVAALQWIHDNIASFGGDPGNVTICGQSGGGQKVTSMLQTPAAHGLFHKAVVQSGVTPHPLSGDPVIKEDSDKSRAVIDLLFKKYNTDKLETLEELTPEELVEACKEIGPDLEKLGFSGNWTAIAGDYYLGDPFVVGFSDYAKTVPVMVGCTFAEFPLMRVFNKHEKSEEEQLAIVQECFPGQEIGALVDLFKRAWPDRCLTDVIEMSGRMEVRTSILRYSDLRAATCDAPTFTYLFAHDFPQEGGRGAWHCAEIPMMFHNSCFYPENFNAGVLDGFEDAVCACWINMAWNGDPNNKYLGVQWPAYKTGDCATLILDDKIEVKKDFDRALIQMRRGMKLVVTDKYTKFTQTVN